MPGVLPLHLQHEAPRLKERSVIARLAFGALCLACCGGVFVVVLTLGQVWFPELMMPSPTPVALQPTLHDMQATGPTTYVSVHGTDPHHRRKPPVQRSVIQRLAMLKRGHGGRGVDTAWTRQLFPHWFDPASPQGEDRFDEQAVLGDLILAVAYLSQAEMED